MRQLVGVLMSRLNAFSLFSSPPQLAFDAPLKARHSQISYISLPLPASQQSSVESSIAAVSKSIFSVSSCFLRLTKVSEMARAVRALAFITLALACLVATAAARASPLGEEKTYAPPYGTPSGSSPVDPTPVVPTPDVPYSPIPYTPSDPSPTTPTPSSPGTCSWWSSNTSSFPDFISILSTILDLFSTITGGSGGSGGSSIISSIFGNQMTIYQGLTNTRTDGYGALARQSSAALLNAYSRPREYAYSPFQVKLQFRNALGNQQQAFQMARVFENANNALGARH